MHLFECRGEIHLKTIVSLVEAHDDNIYRMHSDYIGDHPLIPYSVSLYLSSP